MRKPQSFRPTAPLVINLIALFIVLGGQAIALAGKGRVKRDDIAPGAVTARALAPRVVTSLKLAAHAVTDAGLADQTVSGRSIAPGSVHGPKLTAIIGIPATVPDMDPPGPMGADGNWTTSGATASCPAEMRLLNGGLSITDSTFHKAFIESIFPSPSSASTWVGAISTDTAGGSPGQLFALCLR
jgi:hypothetical protein